MLSSNNVNLLPEEQRTFFYNVDKAMAEQKITKIDLGRRIGMNPTTLGNKLHGHNILRKYEAAAIIQALNIDYNEAFKKIPENVALWKDRSFLTYEEQEIFSHNLNRIMKNRSIKNSELAALVGIDPGTLYHKIHCEKKIRWFEVDKIIQVLGVTKEELFKPVSDSDNDATETDTLKEVKDDLSIKTLALKENLIDLANRLCKKEELTVQEIGALTGLVSAINEM